MARYGVESRPRRGVPRRLRRRRRPYTPAWQRSAGPASTARPSSASRASGQDRRDTGGKCTIIIGAGINHWYHNNLMYRAGITRADPHRVRRARTVAAAQPLRRPGEARAGGAVGADRVRQRLDGPTAPAERAVSGTTCTATSGATKATSPSTTRSPRARRCPGSHDRPAGQGRTQRLAAVLSRSSTRTARDVVRKGARRRRRRPNAAIVTHTSAASSRAISSSRRARHPDAAENWPRVWYIWRGNALMSSAKGHEYFLKHYLGTHHNAIARGARPRAHVKDVKWRDAPRGRSTSSST